MTTHLSCAQIPIRTALGAQAEDALNHPLISEGLAVIPANALVFMKLKAKRRRDLVDVVE